MGNLRLFKHVPLSDEDANPKINYGLRGEGLIYIVSGKELEVGFTWIDGKRIYTETIACWNDGTTIEESEKSKLLIDLLKFTKGWFSKSKVVINSDDPSYRIWQQVCKERPDLVKEIEYTSDRENSQIEKEMYVEMLNSRAGLAINGVEIMDESQLDRVLSEIRQRHETYEHRQSTTSTKTWNKTNVDES